LSFSGLAQGNIYALSRHGYTMVYGTLRMINFAHSEVFMSAPYTAYYRSRQPFTHPVFSIDTPSQV